MKRGLGISNFIKDIDYNKVSKWKGRKEKEKENEKERILNNMVVESEKILSLLKNFA